jgi:cysteinyl-tRNA synthetase
MNITDVDDKIIRNAAAAQCADQRVHTALRAGLSSRIWNRSQIERPEMIAARHRAHSADGGAGGEAG